MSTSRRSFITSVPALGAAFAVAPSFVAEDAAAQTAAPAQPLEGHFHPKGKAPSEHTLRILAEARETLPFGDTQDFEEVARGFIAEMPAPQIPSDTGGIAWDRAAVEFADLLGDGRATAEGDVSVLIQLAGTMVEFDPLFEVLPGTSTGPMQTAEAEALQAVTGQVAIE